MIRLHCIVLHTITLWLLVTFLTGVENFVGGKVLREHMLNFSTGGVKPCLDEHVAFR